jgi:intracellular multiplication protein IcmP
MPPPQGQEGTGVVWVVIGVVVLSALLWYFGHAYIVFFLFSLKRLEIAVLQFFTGEFTYLESVKQFILETSPADVSFSGLSFVTNSVGTYLRYPIIVLTFLMSFILFSKNVAAKYKQTYTMGSLLKYESEVWPYAKLTMGLDLVRKNIHEGPWAVAMQPMVFAKTHKLLREFAAPVAEGTLARDRGVAVSLLKSKAFRLFSLQLGKPWEGIATLEDHVKALFAVFIAKSARDSAKVRHLLRQFAFSSAEGQLDLSGVDETIAKYKDYQPVVEIIDRHGYVLTVMASLLQLARSDGVLSTAEFLWLKPVDRRLWFMLNSVGRQTAVVEVAGPFAHWLAEKEIKRKLRIPMVEQAVKALEIALKEIRYRPGG